MVGTLWKCENKTRAIWGNERWREKIAALSLPTPPPPHPCFSHHFFTARLHYYLGAGSLERNKIVASLYLTKLRTGFYQLYVHYCLQRCFNLSLICKLLILHLLFPSRTENHTSLFGYENTDEWGKNKRTKYAESKENNTKVLPQRRLGLPVLSCPILSVVNTPKFACCRR